MQAATRKYQAKILSERAELSHLPGVVPYGACGRSGTSHMEGPTHEQSYLWRNSLAAGASVSACTWAAANFRADLRVNAGFWWV
jgi:hypothetical protein